MKQGIRFNAEIVKVYYGLLTIFESSQSLRTSFLEYQVWVRSKNSTSWVPMYTGALRLPARDSALGPWLRGAVESVS